MGIVFLYGYSIYNDIFGKDKDETKQIHIL